MGYWDRTDEVKRELGEQNPTCPIHKCEMFPIDDHGRFACFQCGLDKVQDLGGEED